MDIVLASNNLHKLNEVRKILSDRNIFSLADIGFFSEIEEDGNTIEENALLKVRALRPCTNKMVIADDTGLFVEALGGEPGVYSARYAGEYATFADNNAKLLEALKNKENRNASFRCAIALKLPGGDEKIFVGEVEGIIVQKPIGESGFGYDPIFFVTELQKTYAQMSEDEKNQYSHRALALRKLKQYLSDYEK